jgi:hypothetical protein
LTERVPSYLPVIEKADFPLFRQLMDRGFQNKYRNYNDWLVQHQFWAEQYGDGQAVPIMITSVDFAEAERVKHDPPDMDELLDYTERLGEISAS